MLGCFGCAWQLKYYQWGLALKMHCARLSAVSYIHHTFSCLGLFFKQLGMYLCNQVPESGASQQIQYKYFEIVLSDMALNH